MHRARTLCWARWQRWNCIDAIHRPTVAEKVAPAVGDLNLTIAREADEGERERPGATESGRGENCNVRSEREMRAMSDVSGWWQTQSDNVGQSIASWDRARIIAQRKHSVLFIHNGRGRWQWRRTDRTKRLIKFVFLPALTILFIVLLLFILIVSISIFLLCFVATADTACVCVVLVPLVTGLIRSEAELPRPNHLIQKLHFALFICEWLVRRAIQTRLMSVEHV